MAMALINRLLALLAKPTLPTVLKHRIILYCYYTQLRALRHIIRGPRCSQSTKGDVLLHRHTGRVFVMDELD